MSIKRHFNRLRPVLCTWALFSTFLFIIAINPASGTTSFLNNGRFKLGVRTDSGACLDYFGLSTSGPNIVNSFDRGRFIQQSYYGNPDGSSWSGYPWRWNPVQGGSANGQPSTLLSFSNTGKMIYAKTMPRRWSTGGNAPRVSMEEWIQLHPNYAHVHYKMT